GLEVAVAGRHRIGKEHQVELGALGCLGNRDVVLDIDASVDFVVRVPPGGDVVACRMGERAELHVAARAWFRHRVKLVVAYDASSPRWRIPASLCGGASQPRMLHCGLAFLPAWKGISMRRSGGDVNS